MPSSKNVDRPVGKRRHFKVRLDFSLLFPSLVLAGGLLGCNSVNMPNAVTTAGFQQTNLVADVSGTARHTDPGLASPRGVAFIPGQAFWVVDSVHGRTRIYDASGSPAPPIGIAIPVPAGGGSPATPTAVVFNPIPEDFHISGETSQFLFATQDGTISGWASDSQGNFPTLATLAIDHSSVAASYTGLAIPAPACCREFLAAANFHSGSIETFTVGFDALATPGSFTDPNLPSGYAPFGIQVVAGQIFVTYALQDGAQCNPAPGSGNGLVDIFDLEGNFIKRFASNGPLNAPWAVVKASANFGVFSNDILVGNFGDGTINAFHPVTGAFLGSLQDSAGRAIVNPGLWALVFGENGSGDPNSLYFTAGTDTGHALFGAISVAFGR
jgi:uncharacterized protein (TIGR03118 family)